MLKNDRVMGISVKIFVKNSDFRKNIFHTLSFFKRLEIDLSILIAGIVFSKAS